MGAASSKPFTYTSSSAVILPAGCVEVTKVLEYLVSNYISGDIPKCPEGDFVDTVLWQIQMVCTLVAKKTKGFPSFATKIEGDLTTFNVQTLSLEESGFDLDKVATKYPEMVDTMKKILVKLGSSFEYKK